MAIAPVVIEFMARGMPNIARAFRSVEQTIAQHEARSGRSVAAGSRQKEVAYQRVAREAERWHRHEVRAAEKAVREETRAVERGAKSRDRIRERSATMAGRYAAKQASDEVRQAERTARAVARIRERSATMAGQFAAREASKTARIEARAKREFNRAADAESLGQRERFAGALGRGTANAATFVSRGVGAVANSVLQLGGGFSVQDSVQDKVTLDRQATLLANKAILPGGGRANKNQILSKVRAASIATGTDEDKLLSAWGSYTDKTGDFEGGEKNLGFFGKLAKATGSDIEQVAKSAGQLRVQNKNLGEKEMKQLLLDVVQQGRSGSVDMPELARSAGKITRTSSSYAGSQTENQRKLLGLSQVAMRTSGSVEEAATVLSNISADASKHAGKMKGVLGADAFNERGQIAKAPEEFLADVMEKTGGNLQKVQGMGFGARSMKMFQALAPVFEEGLAKGGAKGGRAAVLADMKQFTGATYDEKSLDRDFAEVMKSSAEQFEGAVRALKQEVGDKLVPELLKLVPVLRELTPQLARLLEGVIRMAEWASKNPFEGLAMLIGASITKEIVAAEIGSTIKSLIANGGGGVPGAPGGVGGITPAGTSTTAATAGSGLAAGLLVGAGSAMQLDALGRTADMVYGGYAQGSKRADELAKMSASGPAGAAQAASEIDQAKQNSGVGDWAQAAVTTVSRGADYLNPFSYAGRRLGDYATEKVTGKGPVDVAQAQKTFSASEVASRETEINEAAKKLASAMTNAANTVDAANPNSTARNQPLNARGGTQ